MIGFENLNKRMHKRVKSNMLPIKKDQIMG